MSADQLRAMLERGELVTVVDVRTAQDRAEWFIPGSLHVDVHDALWANDPRALSDFVLPSPGPIVTVCGQGRTSMLAVQRLRARGFEARSLQGGMRTWSLAWNTAPVPVPGTSAEVIQVRRTGKGCLSYLVGSAGAAAVIDPSVDPEVYRGLAGERGWSIVAVLDTHVHADHLSRARELAARTGAKLYLPDQRRVRYPFNPLKDGDTVAVGQSVIDVWYTPGHTFESSCFVLDQHAVFTGDTLFLTTVGRPDLAAKADAETSNRARLLYASLQRLRSLRVETIVLPCHTSEPIPFDGRALARSLGDAWAAVDLLRLTESRFVNAILARIPPPPANHLKIVQLNEDGTSVADPTDLEAGANRCAVT
ncbi:MAG: MBL fold metallo-hydrolase [Gemmatimonadetes bacterium]|nr:MBL fold metallo-hydrolase [Gemmatimonadota bacterium]